MQNKRTIIKTADKILQALKELQDRRRPEILERLTNFVSQFQELDTEARKLGKSLAHSWQMAADRCCSRAHRLLADITYSVSRIRQLTETPHSEVPNLSFLVGELEQLQAEFGDIDFDKEADTLSVTTEPITLDDVYLGPFKIQLELNKLSELYKGSPYYCVALEPNPPASAEHVTHPHVSDERLCEGDGSAAITASLEQGRLSDFFTMIRSILNTYNPDSPYVSLSDWYGTACYDCGYTMSSEDAYFCYHCDNEYCGECSTCCPICDETVCLGCAGQCSFCEETVCPECITECPECGSVCCRSCLEDGVCPNCNQEKETKENEEQQENTGKPNERDENKNRVQTDNAEAIKLAG